MLVRRRRPGRQRIVSFDVDVDDGDGDAAIAELDRLHAEITDSPASPKVAL